MNTITKNPSEMISLAQLTPLNCKDPLDNKVLQVQLSNYKNIVDLTLTAVDTFLEGNFSDPLVGENACQIRAAMYCEVAQDQQVMIQLKKLSITLKGIDLTTTNTSLKGKEMVLLMDAIDKNQMNILIPEAVAEVVTLILFGHILAVTKLSDLKIENKEVSLKEQSDPKRLPKFTLNFAKELIKEGRKTLSERSINYLHHDVDLLPMSMRKERLRHLLDTMVLIDSIGLQSFPCLPGMKILLESMKMHRTAIILKDLIIDSGNVKRGATTLVCQPIFNHNQTKCRYGVVQDPSKMDPNQPAFIIEGVAFSDRTAHEIRKSLVKIGAEAIILANCATHNQYGGSNKNIEPPDTKTRTNLIKFAEENGLCAAQPSLFRIFHILAGTLGQHLQEVTL